ncbi:hypothetical protein RF11_00958 [Thelohanellus kitauei]|uniref:Uncharacterized protein n=1 Tax=Thelohanellus kitauei TaxID=669202 RepID=A0A0C2J2K1_THEKT|nr:hypothetical protein RF11_00958 [Thelohanellus kitauei]
MGQSSLVRSWLTGDKGSQRHGCNRLMDKVGCIPLTNLYRVPCNLLGARSTYVRSIHSLRSVDCNLIVIRGKKYPKRNLKSGWVREGGFESGKSPTLFRSSMFGMNGG